MAYLRGRTYIYRADDFHFYHDDGSITIPPEDVDAFVAMRWAEIVAEGREQQVKEFAIQEGYGNFGCDDLAKQMGMKTVMETVHEELNKREEQEESK